MFYLFIDAHDDEEEDDERVIIAIFQHVSSLGFSGVNRLFVVVDILSIKVILSNKST